MTPAWFRDRRAWPAPRTPAASAPRQPTTDALGRRSSGRATPPSPAGRRLRTRRATRPATGPRTPTHVADDHDDERVGDEVPGDARRASARSAPPAGRCGGAARRERTGRLRRPTAPSRGSVTHAASGDDNRGHGDHTDGQPPAPQLTHRRGQRATHHQGKRRCRRTRRWWRGRRDWAGTSRAPIGAITDHISPWVSAHSTRPTASTAKVGASAEISCDTVRHTSVQSRVRRRGQVASSAPTGSWSPRRPRRSWPAGVPTTASLTCRSRAIAAVHRPASSRR